MLSLTHANVTLSLVSRAVVEFAYLWLFIMYNWRESAYHRTKATGLEATLPSASRQIRLPALHFASTSVTTTIDRDLSPSLPPTLSSFSPFHSERCASTSPCLLPRPFSLSLSSYSLASLCLPRLARGPEWTFFCDFGRAGRGCN